MGPVQKGYSAASFSFSDGVDGYHSRRYLQLAHQTFRSALSTDSYASLNNVKAPSLESGYYCDLSDCQIGKVSAESFCKCSGSTINSLDSNFYVDLSNSVIQSINATGFVKAAHSQIASIKNDYYVTLDDVQNVQTIRSKGFITAKDSRVETISSGYYVDLRNGSVDSVTATGFVIINGTTVGTCNSGYYASLTGATVNQLTCQRLEGDNSKIVSVKAQDVVNLKNCEIIEKVEADEMVGSTSAMLGTLDIKTSVSLTDCKNVAQIKSKEVTLNQCSVLGDVQAAKATLRHTTVAGTLTAANRELKLSESRIKKVILLKPNAAPAAIAADGNELPDEAAALARAIQSGQVHIRTLPSGGYSLHIGDQASQQSAFSLMSIGNVSVSASNCGSMGINRGILTVANLRLNISERNIAAALNSFERPVVAPAAGVAVAPKPQTLIISGGEVEEVVFEAAGGIVLCQNGGRVGKVTNGTQEDKKELIPAEPPEHFVDPVHLEIMANPYRTPLNHAYNYATLVQLADKKTKEFLCPLTRQRFTLDQCRPDAGLKSAIQEWLKTHRPI